MVSQDMQKLENNPTDSPEEDHFLDDSDSDDDETPRRDRNRARIRVGDNYQAILPELQPLTTERASADLRGQQSDLHQGCVFDSAALEESNVDQFLSTTHKLMSMNAPGITPNSNVEPSRYEIEPRALEYLDRVNYNAKEAMYRIISCHGADRDEETTAFMAENGEEELVRGPGEWTIAKRMDPAPSPVLSSKRRRADSTRVKPVASWPEWVEMAKKILQTNNSTNKANQPTLWDLISLENESKRLSMRQTRPNCTMGELWHSVEAQLSSLQSKIQRSCLWIAKSHDLMSSTSRGDGITPERLRKMQTLLESGRRDLHVKLTEVDVLDAMVRNIQRWKKKCREAVLHPIKYLALKRLWNETLRLHCSNFDFQADLQEKVKKSDILADEIQSILRLDQYLQYRRARLKQQPQAFRSSSNLKTFESFKEFQNTLETCGIILDDTDAIKAIFNSISQWALQVEECVRPGNSDPSAQDIKDLIAQTEHFPLDLRHQNDLLKAKLALGREWIEKIRSSLPQLKTTRRSGAQKRSKMQYKELQLLMRDPPITETEHPDVVRLTEVLEDADEWVQSIRSVIDKPKLDATNLKLLKDELQQLQLLFEESQEMPLELPKEQLEVQYEIQKREWILEAARMIEMEPDKAQSLDKLQAHMNQLQQFHYCDSSRSIVSPEENALQELIAKGKQWIDDANRVLRPSDSKSAKQPQLSMLDVEQLLCGAQTLSINLTNYVKKVERVQTQAKQLHLRIKEFRDTLERQTSEHRSCRKEDGIQSASLSSTSHMLLPARALCDRGEALPIDIPECREFRESITKATAWAETVRAIFPQLSRGRSKQKIDQVGFIGDFDESYINSLIKQEESLVFSFSDEIQLLQEELTRQTKWNDKATELLVQCQTSIVKFVKKTHDEGDRVALTTQDNNKRQMLKQELLVCQQKAEQRSPQSQEKTMASVVANPMTTPLPKAVEPDAETNTPKIPLVDILTLLKTICESVRANSSLHKRIRGIEKKCTSRDAVKSLTESKQAEETLGPTSKDSADTRAVSSTTTSQQDEICAKVVASAHDAVNEIDDVLNQDIVIPSREPTATDHWKEFDQWHDALETLVAEANELQYKPQTLERIQLVTSLVDWYLKSRDLCLDLDHLAMDFKTFDVFVKEGTKLSQVCQQEANKWLQEFLCFDPEIRREHEYVELLLSEWSEDRSQRLDQWKVFALRFQMLGIDTDEIFQQEFTAELRKLKQILTKIMEMFQERYDSKKRIPSTEFRELMVEMKEKFGRYKLEAFTELSNTLLQPLEEWRGSIHSIVRGLDQQQVEEQTQKEKLIQAYQEYPICLFEASDAMVELEQSTLRYCICNQTTKSRNATMAEMSFRSLPSVEENPNEKEDVMIGCDACNDWYHSQCVGVLPQEEVDESKTTLPFETLKDDEKYFCPSCRTLLGCKEITEKCNVSILKVFSVDERMKHQDRIQMGAIRKAHKEKNQSRRLELIYREAQRSVEMLEMAIATASKSQSSSTAETPASSEKTENTGEVSTSSQTKQQANTTPEGTAALSNHSYPFQYSQLLRPLCPMPNSTSAANTEPGSPAKAPAPTTSIAAAPSKIPTIDTLKAQYQQALDLVKSTQVEMDNCNKRMVQSNALLAEVSQRFQIENQYAPVVMRWMEKISAVLKSKDLLREVQVFPKTPELAAILGYSPPTAQELPVAIYNLLQEAAQAKILNLSFAKPTLRLLRCILWVRLTMQILHQRKLTVSTEKPTDAEVLRVISSAVPLHLKDKSILLPFRHWTTRVEQWRKQAGETMKRKANPDLSKMYSLMRAKQALPLLASNMKDFDAFYKECQESDAKSKPGRKRKRKVSNKSVQKPKQKKKVKATTSREAVDASGSSLVSPVFQVRNLHNRAEATESVTTLEHKDDKSIPKQEQQQLKRPLQIGPQPESRKLVKISKAPTEPLATTST